MTIFQSALMSGSTKLDRSGAGLVLCGRYRRASTKPDSLMPSRIASLITKYVIQRPIAVASADAANINIVARQSSASITWMFIRFPEVVSNRNVCGGAA